MRILIVNTVPTDRNGITNVIFNLIRRFDSDWKIGYVAIDKPDRYYVNQLEDLGIKLYIIPRKLSNPIKYIVSLAKTANGYDIMHVHGNSATMLLEMIAAKLGVVSVRGAHAHNTSCYMRCCDKICRPLFYALCNCRFACGIAAGKWLFGSRQFKIINNGIDTDKYRFSDADRKNIRNVLGIESSVVIGHVGNFVDAKNHFFLIDVFSKIIGKIPNAKLMLLGNGDLIDSIRQKVIGLKLADHVIFAGSVNNPETYMSAMDMVIMPSLYEGFPLTLVEEQANGLHCLVSDIITKEVNMTGNIHFMSLESSASEWAEKALNILKNLKKDRNGTSREAKEDVCKKGYDIYRISNDLKDYYIEELTKLK